MKLEKYSFGMGDRFGKEGTAQLQAIQEINNLGVEVVPVWNKSNREHTIIGSSPAMVRREAIDAVAACRYKGKYYTDADHINSDTVDRFIDSHDFFTLDVAHFIGSDSLMMSPPAVLSPGTANTWGQCRSAVLNVRSK